MTKEDYNRIHNAFMTFVNQEGELDREVGQSLMHKIADMRYKEKTDFSDVLTYDEAFLLDRLKTLHWAVFQESLIQDEQTSSIREGFFQNKE